MIIIGTMLFKNGHTIVFIMGMTVIKHRGSDDNSHLSRDRTQTMQFDSDYLMLILDMAVARC